MGDVGSGCADSGATMPACPSGIGIEGAFVEAPAVGGVILATGIASFEDSIAASAVAMEPCAMGSWRVCIADEAAAPRSCRVVVHATTNANNGRHAAILNPDISISPVS